MQRQAIIYAAYAGLGASLFTHLLRLSAIACEQFGLSSTFAVVCALAILFGVLTLFSAWVSYLFKRRVVVAITRNGNGFFLVLERSPFMASINANKIHVIRKFGEQFSRNEHIAKYTLFQAGKRYWITELPVESQTYEFSSEA